MFILHFKPYWTNVFDNRGNCQVEHTFAAGALDVTITKIWVTRKDGQEVQFTIPSTTLRALVIDQAWTTNAFSEADWYKKLAGTRSPTQNVYIFSDGDALNYDGACTAASGGGTGRQTTVCSGTPLGLVSFGAANSGLWADAGSCNYQWGHLVQAMYVA